MGLSDKQRGDRQGDEQQLQRNENEERLSPLTCLL